MAKKKVLFLCTGNSCRSQIAEALINHEMGDQWEAVSAGTHPEIETNPFALRALAEHGVLHEGKPKLADKFREEKLDLVITLCDDAAEKCPVWLGEGAKIHNAFDDPAKIRGTDSELMTVYRQTLKDILDEIPPILEAF